MSVCMAKTPVFSPFRATMELSAGSPRDGPPVMDGHNPLRQTRLSPPALSVPVEGAATPNVPIQVRVAFMSPAGGAQSPKPRAQSPKPRVQSPKPRAQSPSFKRERTVANGLRGQRSGGPLSLPLWPARHPRATAQHFKGIHSLCVLLVSRRRQTALRPRRAPEGKVLGLLFSRLPHLQECNLGLDVRARDLGAALLR